LQVTDLLQLSCLTRLKLHYGRNRDAKELLQLPQLQHLEVYGGRMTDAFLGQLTGLQQLTMLQVDNYGSMLVHLRNVAHGFTSPGKYNQVGAK
jgi:hypothetical protein